MPRATRRCAKSASNAPSGLIATLASDADNLFVTLSAKTLNPSLKHLRARRRRGGREKMRRAGAESVFAPYDITGHRMAQAMLRPHVSQFIDFTTKNVGLDVGIEQVRVAEGSEFVDRTLAQMQVRRELGVIVLAIRKADGTMHFNPPAEAVIDRRRLPDRDGRTGDLRRLERLLTPEVTK